MKIFATFGTAKAFPRLLARLDELAQETGIEVVVQTSETPQTAKYCKMFDYAPSLTDYLKSADFVISHAGLGSQLDLLRHHIPFVVVPRRAEFGEHNDNHQIETCEILSRKYGIKYFLDVNEITVEFLRATMKPYPFEETTLQLFRKNILNILEGGK